MQPEFIKYVVLFNIRIVLEVTISKARVWNTGSFLIQTQNFGSVIQFLFINEGKWCEIDNEISINISDKRQLRKTVQISYKKENPGADPNADDSRESWRTIFSPVSTLKLQHRLRF